MANVHLWGPLYSAKQGGGRGYGWRLEVHGSTECLLYSGRNAVPEGFGRLCDLFEAAGLPFAFDAESMKPLTCDSNDKDFTFVEAMDAFEGSQDDATSMVRALATADDASKSALLKLLRMNENETACTFFSQAERDGIARAWQTLLEGEDRNG